MKTESSIATARGPRERLEDRAAALVLGPPVPLPWPVAIAAVADGVGGNRGGAEAAQTCLSAGLAHALGALLARSAMDDPPGRADLVAIASSALTCANDAVLRAQQGPGPREMATTGLVAIAAGADLAVAWTGDSGCLLVRGGQARPLTAPQTRAHELIRLGLLDAAEAADHPASRTLVHWIGKPVPEIATAAATLRPGDLLVFYSDGLLEGIGPEQIADLTAQPPFEDAARRLVDAALAAGSRDNVTSVCLRARPAHHAERDYLCAVGHAMENSR